MNTAIRYYAEKIESVPTFNKKIIAAWIKEIIQVNKKSAKGICYIFCDDVYLLSLNQKYLKHQTLTDIITFDYGEDADISGDIFISIDRVHENSNKYGITFDKELFRVMCHGILHLLGHKGKNAAEKKEMRSLEDYWLSILFQKGMKVKG